MLLNFLQCIGQPLRTKTKKIIQAKMSLWLMFRNPDELNDIKVTLNVCFDIHPQAIENIIRLSCYRILRFWRCYLPHQTLFPLRKGKKKVSSGKVILFYSINLLNYCFSLFLWLLERLEPNLLLPVTIIYDCKIQISTNFIAALLFFHFYSPPRFSFFTNFFNCVFLFFCQAYINPKLNRAAFLHLAPCKAQRRTVYH